MWRLLFNSQTDFSLWLTIFFFHWHSLHSWLSANFLLDHQLLQLTQWPASCVETEYKAYKLDTKYAVWTKHMTVCNAQTYLKFSCPNCWWICQQPHSSKEAKRTAGRLKSLRMLTALIGEVEAKAGSAFDRLGTADFGRLGTTHFDRLGTTDTDTDPYHMMLATSHSNLDPTPNLAEQIYRHGYRSICLQAYVFDI